MSWDQPTVSFGNPNAQPPTPSQTPTSANLPSPIPRTPLETNFSNEERGNWTPTFAEDYSVFHSTPGRLTSNHLPFAEFGTPRPYTSPAFPRKLSSADQIAAQLATHVHHLTPNSSLPLPPVDPSNQLASSPGAHVTTFSGLNTTTPTRTTSTPENPYSRQTATPPASQSKGTRKLAPKRTPSTMQNDAQESHFDFSQTPNHVSYMMDFPATTADFMSYPLSAPATAPLFSNAKSFWDTDQTMGGMDMDFNSNSAHMFGANTHKVTNSVDWVRENQIFQEQVNINANSAKMILPSNDQPAKRSRPLAPKVDLSELLKTTPALPLFEVNDPSQSRPPSAKRVDAAVDPAHLWSRPNNTSPTKMAPPSSKASSVSPTHPTSSQAQLQPYSQQVRESMRDQLEYQEYQAERLRARQRADKAALISPVRGGARPGLQRSLSESKSRRIQDRPVSRPAGRTSPLKRIAGLSSIPETSSSMRTEVKFVIDKNGRASTETIIVKDRSQSLHDDLQSQSDTSDDDLPMTLSRNTSFDLPRQIAPKFGRPEVVSRGRDAQRHASQASYSHSDSSRSSRRRDSLDSEAETVMEADMTGDATQEIRKMMHARKQPNNRVSGATVLRHPSDIRPRPGYYAPSSNVSPTHTDGSGATPSSARSGTTRCVCKRTDNEGFMIQCESCDCWLHTGCVGIDQYSLPPVYICAYCAQTPNKRGPRVRDMTRGSNQGVGISPLAHKSFQSFR